MTTDEMKKQPTPKAKRKKKADPLLTCSFCGKSQNDVFKLVAGPGVYICNECICICIEILSDNGKIIMNTQILELMFGWAKLELKDK